MTIEREAGEIIFLCDACGESEHTEQSEFADAHALVKREGWKTKKVVGEWMHFCSDCNAE